MMGNARALGCVGAHAFAGLVRTRASCACRGGDHGCGGSDHGCKGGDRGRIVALDARVDGFLVSGAQALTSLVAPAQRDGMEGRKTKARRRFPTPLTSRTRRQLPLPAPLGHGGARR